MTQTGIAGSNRIDPVQVATARKIKRLDLCHRERIAVGITSVVGRGDAREAGVVEGGTGHRVAVVYPHLIPKTGLQSTAVVGRSAAGQRGFERAAENARVVTSLNEGQGLALSSGGVDDNHRQLLNAGCAGILVTVGHLYTQGRPHGEVDQRTGEACIPKFHRTIGGRRWWGTDTSGQFQIAVAAAGVARRCDAPIGGVVNACSPIGAGEQGCVIRGIRGLPQRQCIHILCFEAVTYRKIEVARVVAAGYCISSGAQGGRENTGVVARFGQRDRFKFTGGVVGHPNLDHVERAGTSVLVAVNDLQPDGVGASNVGAHGFGEARIHEKNLTICNRTNIDHGLVVLFLLDTRTIHRHGVGDGVAAVSERFVDGVADRDAIAHLDHAAPLEAIGHNTGQINIANRVA